MKVKINGEVKDFRTVWMEGSTVKLINQPLLPHRFEIYDCKDYQETARAIKTMVVRGAPAIGATGAYGLAQAVMQFKVGFRRSGLFTKVGTDNNVMANREPSKPKNVPPFVLQKAVASKRPEGGFSAFTDFLSYAEQTLKGTRPTAYDLFYAIDMVKFEVLKAESLEEAREIAKKASQDYADNSAEQCRKIGEYGRELIKDGMGILTHCNAGALACVDYGTALAPIRFAHYQGREFFIFADETRPRCQGSQLTAWELVQEGIRHAIIADNAAGHFMQRGEIDLVITGADRIAANGDAANKIGTYEKAVVARENDIPFYIAAPSSTLDFNCPSGKEIPIEERGQEEVLYVSGFSESGKPARVSVAPGGSPARNPAFDVTPARFIKGFITEHGIFKPGELGRLREVLMGRKD